MANTFVGVDRGRDVWLAVAFDADGYDHSRVFEEIGELWSSYEETAALILVDMPIGLVESGASGRRCDELARSVLGPRRQAIFPPPVREATRKRRYPAAKRVNERKSDASLSKQAFAISDQIAAVDDLLRNVPEARATFRESHPEVCFRAFAGEPLQHSKKTAGGYAERMRALAEFDRDAPPTVQSVAEATAGNRIPIPAVVDAVALGLTIRPGPGELRSLPVGPPEDERGLEMRYVYRSETPLSEP